MSFGTEIPSLNGAYRLSQTIRVGMGVGYAFTGLNQDQTINDRLVLPTGCHDRGPNVLDRRQCSPSSPYRRRAVGSRAGVTLGTTVTSPGIRIGGSSKVKFKRILFEAGGAEDDLAFRDPDANFDLKIPLRATAGATFRYSRGQVELDVRYHGAEDAYEMFSSDSTASRLPLMPRVSPRSPIQLLPQCSTRPAPS